MTRDNFHKNHIVSPYTLSPDMVLEALGPVQDPVTHESLGKSKRVQVVIAETGIHVLLTIEHQNLRAYEAIQSQMEQAIAQHPRVKASQLPIRVILTEHTHTDAGGSQSPLFRGQYPMASIKHVIAVASGKGGVGKSSMTALLAYSLKHLGYKVAILDADIYGPSIPTLLGQYGYPETQADQKIIPLEKDGIHYISMGLLVDANAPIIWRGPMAQQAIQQFLARVEWGDQDILLLDLPPGTGDIQLTLIQRAPMAGAVIVSTPQDLALLDAKRAIAMFEKVHVPVLGLIENMSTFVCPHCGESTDIFAHGGAQQEAEKQGISFLGAVPLTQQLRHHCDEGRIPTFLQEASLAAPFVQIASRLSKMLTERALGKAGSKAS